MTEQDPEPYSEQDPDVIFGRLISWGQNDEKKIGHDKTKVNLTFEAIVVDCQRDLFNGLVDVNRDVLMKLIRILKDDEKTRNIMGMSQTFYAWSKIRVFRWAAKNIHKPLLPHPRLPDSAFQLGTTCEVSYSSNKASKIRVVIVGDGCVGKTCLLISHARDEFPSGYIPTVYTGYEASHVFEGRNILVDVEDTAGQDEFDFMHPLIYPVADVFLVCCSVSNRSSLLHVTTKWIPEIKKHTTDIPMILVGTKLDLRVGTRRSDSSHSPAEARAVARKLGMAEYIECSSKLHRNVEMVFRAAFYYALLKNVKHQNQCFFRLN